MRAFAMKPVCFYPQPHNNMRRMQKAPATFHTLKPFLGLFQTGVPVLMYHKIAAPPPRARLKGLYVRPERFASQLSELHQAGFVSCRPGESRDGNGPARRMALTFDDGFRNVWEHALQPLAAHGFSAIQFLVANFIGRLNQWEIREGEVREPLMDAAQVRDWLSAGHRIGSHSLSHPYLTRLSMRDAREEIVTSRKKLEDTFGVAVEDFCYPYGNWNETVRELVIEAGYRTACAADYGVNSPDISPFSLRRIIVRHPTRSLKVLKSLLLGA
jgi:peptidoglycan/xylan/chitin deacetylase (PgdA/CDA1 family)